MDTDRTVNFLWHGPRMGEVHAACIRSFKRHGYHARLHCYAPPADAPDGVEIFDAQRVMPKSDLLAESKTGSVAFRTNRYRYQMIEAGFGVYADCDMFLLRPLPEDDYLIGLEYNAESGHACNNALLRYPQSCALSRELVHCTLDEYATLPWKRRRRHVLSSILLPLGLAPSARNEPWGVWGPALVSHWVKFLDLLPVCRPIDVFYPLHHSLVDFLFDPCLRLEHLVTPRTVAIHLSHKMSRKKAISAGSAMGQIVKDHV